MPTKLLGGDGRKSKIALLLIYSLITLVRTPYIIFKGRFWGEEATLFFSYAYTHSWLDALLNSPMDYYLLTANIGTLLASRIVPIEYSPLVTAWLALLVQLLPAVLVLFSNAKVFTGLSRKAVALFLILFLAPHEIWLSTTTSQFFLALCTGIILVSSTNSRAVKGFRFGVLAMAGLTGVVSNLLTPLFWLKAFMDRSRQNILNAAILTITTGVQLFILFARPSLVSHTPAFEPKIFFYSLFVKSICGPLMGSGINENISPYLLNSIETHSAPIGVYIAIGAIIILAILHFSLFGDSEVRYLAASGLIIMGVSYLFALGYKPGLVLYYPGGRYYYAPNALFYLALLGSLSYGNRLNFIHRTAVAVLIAVALYSGSGEYFKPIPDIWKGPDWQSEIKLWREDSTHVIAVWPAPWVMPLTVKEPASLPEAK